MQRKNWAIPGFLALAMLLLFSFPAVVSAAESGLQTTVTGEEVPASQPAQQEQAPGGDTAAGQESTPLPAQSDLITDPVPVNATPVSDGAVDENQSVGQASDAATSEPSEPVEPAEPAEPAVPSEQEQSGGEPILIPDSAAPTDQDQALGDQQPVPAPASPDSGRADDGPAPAPEAPVPGNGSRVDEKPLPECQLPSPVRRAQAEVKPVSAPEPVPAEPGKSDGIGVTPPDVQVQATRPSAWSSNSIPASPAQKVSAARDRSASSAAEVAPVVGPKAKIKAANGLIVDDKTIALPAEQVSATSISGGDNDGHSLPQVTYRVREGESLWLIGRALGILYGEIIKANDLTDHLIYPDQQLIIPGVDSPKGIITYRIKAGDSLYFIARALGLSYEDIMSLNGINDIWIYPDHELQIPDRNKTTLYKVQEGESLDEVAAKFKVSAGDITGFRLSTGQLIVGQVLVIPVQPGVSRGFQLTRATVPMGSDLEILARAIYGEARGEIYEGQVAVGAVIVNRLKTVGFPKTIRDIVFQPGAFTAVDDGQINLVPDETAYKAAQDAMDGVDPSLGAIYYWNPDTATSNWIWTRPIIKQIGNHVFAR